MNRIKVGIVLSVFLALLLFTCTKQQLRGVQANVDQQSSDVPKAIGLIRPNIVQIIRRLPPEAQAWPIIPLGSGFFVSPGYVITNRHVINGVRPEELMIALPLPDSERMRGAFDDAKAIVVDQDEAHDLALLQVRRTQPSSIINGKEVQNGMSPPSFNLDRPRDGTQIAVSGYPLQNYVMVTNVGWIASAWHRDEKPAGGDRYIADMRVNRGNSGGPVYEIETGKVIGVCVAYQPAPVTSEGKNVGMPGNKDLSYNSGLSVIIPARYVMDLMKKNKLSGTAP